MFEENTSFLIELLNRPVRAFLTAYGADAFVVDMVTLTVALTIIAVLALIANYVAKHFIVRLAESIVKRTPWKWDNKLAENKVFVRLSHLAPAFIINSLGRGAIGHYEQVTAFIGNAVSIYVTVVLLLVISAILNTVREYIERSQSGANVPVKGFFQAVKLIIFMIGAVLVLSVLFGRTPTYFLGGIGAMTAILLLIFRDAILGLVAGVMISVNQMVRIGDWIEMPSNGADGDVIDVSLTTVKVRNWDRTITTVPSYDLISKSFKNWRGMFDNMGRRIKRSIWIDMQTIDFVDEKRLEALMKIRRLRPYLEGKRDEIVAANSSLEEADLSVLANGRRLTNLGTFRAYCVAYLRGHSGVKQEELLIVRQLQPTEHGLPLEVYCFTSDTAWVKHEATQADIFDHLLSIISEFGLKVFQAPAGSDVRQFIQRASGGEPASSGPEKRPTSESQKA